MDFRNVKIGEVLLSAGYITEEQLNEALDYQKENRSKRLADILIDFGFITEDQKLEALGKRLDMPVVNLNEYPVKMEAVEAVSKATSVKHNVIGIDYVDGKLLLAVNDPMNFFAVEEIRQTIKKPINLCLANLGDIIRAIDYYYSEIQAKKAATTANLSAAQIKIEEEASFSYESDSAPVVKLLNSLLLRGYNSNVSDIHIEPFEEKVVVRMRVDGMIVEYVTLSINLHQPLIARIKILANMDIAEKRAPQDGHFRITLEKTELNIRVSVMPMVYGEKAVLRYLSTNVAIDNEDSFGMNKNSYEKMKRILENPHGIVYFTGPTGSGKTTTLYMILRYLSNRAVNISTIEDPVEKNIPKINQAQIAPAAGLTFETGLRSILRQDPDIIMVGETRDTETAEISVRAAITGHLVLSTLHTNDSVSTIVRLEDMGVPRHLIANALAGAVAQRLVRKVCPECGYEYAPDEVELKLLGVSKAVLRKGKGCRYCNNTGYKGRVSIHEIVEIDSEIRRMITKNATSDEILSYAVSKQGMKTLKDAVLELVLNGTTTIEEYVKTAYYS